MVITCIMMMNRPVFLKLKLIATLTVTSSFVQVDKTIDIFDSKYPSRQGLFLFDYAPSHKKFPEDALKVKNMYVRPGGKQLVMRTTVFNGEEQLMVLSGRP